MFWKQLKNVFHRNFICKFQSTTVLKNIYIFFRCSIHRNRPDFSSECDKLPKHAWSFNLFLQILNFIFKDLFLFVYSILRSFISFNFDWKFQTRILVTFNKLKSHHCIWFVCCCHFTALMLTCFRQTKNCVMLFWTEIIVASFLHLKGLFCKLVINHLTFFIHKRDNHEEIL